MGSDDGARETNGVVVENGGGGISSIAVDDGDAAEVEMNTSSNGNKSGVGGDGNTKKRATRSTSSPPINDSINGSTTTTTTTNGKNGGGVPGRRRVRKKKNGGAGGENNAAASKKNKFIKYAALFLLVAQMVGLVLLMRYSRTTPRAPDQPLYLASTAVFIMEVMKLVICLLVVAYQCVVVTGIPFGTELYHHTVGSPQEILKLCVPSLLYTVQNNLLYLALTNLDAATYQVCYQLKILTTALFSAVLLQRKFSPTKWASLVVLTVGVAIVQISGSGDQHSSSNSSKSETEEEAAAMESRNRLVGLIAVLCAACTSGFSGVYFERILKGSRTSLYIRNIQMGLPSVVIAYITVYFKDAAAVKTQGFLGGYTGIVWTVVSVQAVGGLIVATVVKYADNVLKVFATSFSIVISCIISAFLFDFHPTLSFLVGASLVVTATVMYSSPDRKPRRKSILPMTTTARK